MIELLLEHPGIHSMRISKRVQHGLLFFKRGRAIQYFA